MKNIYMFAAVMVTLATMVVSHAAAQSSYMFSHYVSKSQPYTDLVNDVELPEFDSTGLYTPEEFNSLRLSLYGVTYENGPKTRIALGEGGFIGIASDTGIVIIDGAFTYLDSIDATSRISYKIVGDVGDRILIYQYKNYRLRYGPVTNYMNMQMRLFERTGVVEIHYGPRSANNSTGYTIQTGPNVGMFFARPDFSRMYDKLWITGDPEVPTVDSIPNLDIRAMRGLPVDGTIFTFTPKAITSSVSDQAPSAEIFCNEPGAGCTTAIYDLLGNKHMQFDSYESIASLQSHNLAPGIYIACVTSSNGERRSEVFQKAAN